MKRAFFSEVDKTEMSYFNTESDIYEQMVDLYQRLGGRSFTLRNNKDYHHNSTYRIAKLSGFNKHKLFSFFIQKALANGKYLEKYDNGVCRFTEKFRIKLFQYKIYNHQKYERPVICKENLTDQEILLLLCWYRNGRTFTPEADLITELATEIGLKNSGILRQAVNRLIANDQFNILHCKGDVEAHYLTVAFCSFKEETVKTAFATLRMESN